MCFHYGPFTKTRASYVSWFNFGGLFVLFKVGFPNWEFTKFSIFPKNEKNILKKIAGLQFSRQGAMLLDSDPLHQMAKI